MTEKQNDFWFPAKRYGWGWGAPVRWEGWLVLAVWFGFVLAAAVYFRPRVHPIEFVVSFVVAIVLLIVVVALKGEKPLGWRWSKR